MANRQIILAVNTGSSSLKISVYEPRASITDGEEPVTLLLTASFSSIFSSPTTLSFKLASSDISLQSGEEELNDVRGHEDCFEYFLKRIDETELNKDDITQVAHRVVHGAGYSGPVIISEESYNHIESLSDLAPLHNAAALQVIKTCLKVLPNSKSIAFFDTAFHDCIPKHIHSYAIDPEMAQKKSLRKYGFHGLSYAFILSAISRYLKKSPEETTLIVMHLGSGASVCAIKNGKSLDTSMGLTPLDGLPGSSRSGSVDPSLIFHYTSDAGRISHSSTEQMHITDAEYILNKQSGWTALTGTSDFRKIASASSSTSPSDAPLKFAFDLFVDRVLNFVGSYHLKLGGSSQIDAVVFSGGIGERSVELRKAVLDRCACLGFGIDDAKNEEASKASDSVFEIGSSATFKTKTLVCKTDEQLEMGRQCATNPDFA